MSANLIKGISQILDKEQSNFNETWRAQGHTLTGKTERSWEKRIAINSNTIEFQIFIDKVAHIQNYGITPDRIPYTPSARGQGRGGTSKYIQGLVDFWKKRKGLDDKEALSAAFATAKKHKKEGMHTKASLKYSTTGERINALSNQFKTVPQQVVELVDNEVLYIFNSVRN